MPSTSILFTKTNTVRGSFTFPEMSDWNGHDRRSEYTSSNRARRIGVLASGERAETGKSNTEAASRKSAQQSPSDRGARRRERVTNSERNVTNGTYRSAMPKDAASKSGQQEVPVCGGKVAKVQATNEMKELLKSSLGDFQSGGQSQSMVPLSPVKNRTGKKLALLK
jgi:hypothetical protein